MSKMWSGFVPMLVAALALGAFGCSEVEYADSVSQKNPLDSFELELVAGLNKLRKDAGAPTVTASGCASLNASASSHSDDMRDKGYLDDVGLDGSTTPSRACDAGFAVACDGKIAMAELIAKGNGEGTATLDQWVADPNSKPLLLDPQFVVVGVGRSLGGDSAIWTLDLAAATDPSCAASP